VSARNLIRALFWIVLGAGAIFLGYVTFAPATEPTLFKELDSWATTNPVAYWAIIMAIIAILWLAIEMGRFVWSVIAMPNAIARIEAKQDALAKDFTELKK
jgi:hypothetical protein